ncbi:MAG: TolC family protein [Myxococcales bacterium]|jgi:outer membrane protein TolC|nr:TolC family protein [Myxococcales bacterium]
MSQTRGRSRFWFCAWPNEFFRIIALTITLTLLPITALADETTSRLDLNLKAPIPVADETRASSEPVGVDRCVEIALSGSGKIAEAAGLVAEWKARLFEVEANIYPKLQGLAFVAPMFTVEAKDGSSVLGGVQRKWKSLSDWGPYFRLEMLLVQPIYTFGRLSAGEDAANARLEVEKARFEQAKNAVALQTRKFYYLHLYAKSLLPLLTNARKTLDEVLEQAHAMHAEGSGKVSTPDLMKLEIASSEIDKFLVQAKVGISLSLAALKHTMGLSPADPLVLADERLPNVSDDPPPLESLVALAEMQRPEFAQISNGLRAAKSLERAEKLADAPIVAIVGQFQASFAPTREDTDNPYLSDPYNDLFGGVALAIQFGLDPAASHAKSLAARAMGKQVEGLSRFAQTGIPVEVKKAWDEEQQARQLLHLAKKAEVAARKWMIFAGAAYGSGTGETKDFIEGFAAHMQMRKNRLDQLLAVHTARAELIHAVGQRMDGFETTAAAVSSDLSSN